MARFCSFAPLSLLLGWRGIIVSFYFVQDCRRLDFNSGSVVIEPKIVAPQEFTKNTYALRTCVYCHIAVRIKRSQEFTESCGRDNGPCQKHAQKNWCLLELAEKQWILSKTRSDYIKEYSTDLVKKLTHSNARDSFVRFHLWLVEIKRVTDFLGTRIKHTWVARCVFTCDWSELTWPTLFVITDHHT